MPYPPANCTWIIAVPAGKNVNLTFENLEIEDGASVEIRDGLSSDSKEIGTYHRSIKYLKYNYTYSTGRYMRVKFHSHYDGWPRYQGFKAHFEAVCEYLDIVRN